MCAQRRLRGCSSNCSRAAPEDCCLVGVGEYLYRCLRGISQATAPATLLGLGAGVGRSWILRMRRRFGLRSWWDGTWGDLKKIENRSLEISCSVNSSRIGPKKVVCYRLNNNIASSRKKSNYSAPVPSRIQKWHVPLHLYIFSPSLADGRPNCALETQRKPWRFQPRRAASFTQPRCCTQSAL